jgi:carboxypeptidase D
MRSSLFIATLLSVLVVTSALQSPHRKQSLLPKRNLGLLPAQIEKRQSLGPSVFLNKKTEPFAVNGSGLPQVNFDAGESYAGTLPVSQNASDPNRLFFWFWPSDNLKAKNEITIWLNGGPGCSSLDGFFQENGPISWQSGTYEPIRNPYSWTNLTNMVWIDQPIGTGFSPAAPGAPAKIMNETQVAAQFAAFWKNFVDTFDLTGHKVYITGESYAGQYIPYIADAMLNMNDTKYYNVKGVQINDPSINHDDTLQEAPIGNYLRSWENLFALNQTFLDRVYNASSACGYDAFMESALQFPPIGPIPTAPSSRRRGCEIWGEN